MGIRQSKQISEQRIKDSIKEEIIEELTLTTITALSAELNHKLFEIEKTLGERIARSEEEIEILNRVKKNKSPSLFQRIITSPKVHHGKV